MPTPDYSALVPDYINEHLTLQQRADMDAALETDAVLRQQVNFERMLQQSLRTTTEPATARAPHFGAVRQHIEGSARSRRPWLLWGMPAAACVLALALMVDQFAATQQPVQMFETLSDSPTLEATNLRIILRAGQTSATLDALVAQYQLQVVQQYPDMVAADVILSDDQQASNLAQKIALDARVFRVNSAPSK